VVYNDSGDATVKIKENGVTRTVKIGGASDGPGYSCPKDVVEEKIDPTVKLAGRIKLTLHDVETQIDPLEAQIDPLEAQLDTLNERYPGGTAPGAVASRYNSLLARYKSLSSRYNSLVERAEGLESAYNRTIDKHNAVMAQECERE
jgi:flagellar capping protein FliD